MKWQLIVLLWGQFYFSLPYACAQNEMVRLEDPVSLIRPYLTPYLKMQDFSGIVLVCKEDSILFQSAFGYADVDERIPMEVDMPFPLLDITQIFTSAAVLILAHQGKLHLDTPINHLIPGLHPVGHRITVSHLLAHRSGLPDQNTEPTYRGLDAQGLSMDDAISWLKQEPLMFEPGSNYSFSHYNYVLLAYLIEFLGGRPYHYFLQQELFLPLSMQEVRSQIPFLNKDLKLKGYLPTAGAGALQSSSQLKSNLFPGSNNLSGNVYELFTWLQVIQNNPVFYGNTFQHAYGWETARKQGKEMLFRSGQAPGFSTHFSYYPQDKLGIIILSNIQGKVINRIGEDIASIVFRDSYQIPKYRKEFPILQDSLSAYSGTYEVFQDYILFVKETNKGLLLKDMTGPWLPIDPIGPDAFFYRLLYVPLRFERNTRGRISGIVWDGDYFCKKIH